MSRNDDVSTPNGTRVKRYMAMLSAFIGFLQSCNHRKRVQFLSAFLSSSCRNAFYSSHAMAILISRNRSKKSASSGRVIGPRYSTPLRLQSFLGRFEASKTTFNLVVVFLRDVNFLVGIIADYSLLVHFFCHFFNDS